jgi:hypothetical protein
VPNAFGAELVEERRYTVAARTMTIAAAAMRAAARC